MPSKSHRIHLRGPWNYEWIICAECMEGEDAASFGRMLSQSGRAVLPADWRTLFGDRTGRVRLTRRFGRPTNLEPQEHVHLVFDGIGGNAIVHMNEQCLGVIEDRVSKAEFEVTQWLQRSNLLTVAIEFDPHASRGVPGGLWAPVAIEIRSE